MSDKPTTPPKRENIWLNLGLNVLIPSILLTKGQGWLERLAGRTPEAIENATEALPAADSAATANWAEQLLTQCESLGLQLPALVLIIALAFPVIYGIYDFFVRRKYNFFSILGFVSVLISGGIGLLELNKDWVAIKEAAIPALFAIAVVVSLKTPFPLVRTFLFSPEIFDVPKIETALAEKDKQKPFEKLMERCTLMLSGSFLLSAVLNYFVARYFITSDTGTPEFTVELGKMNFWSWPIITVPSMIIMFYILNQLVNGIHDYTGYELEDVMHIGQPAKKKEVEPQQTNVSVTDSDARTAPVPTNPTSDENA